MSESIITFNEGATGYITATFQDKTGASVAPSSARYRIDCETSGQEVLTWTNIASPQAAHELTITPANNAIIDDSNATETKVLTIEGTYGASDKVPDEVRYQVNNLSNYP